ncbi:MAG TPA: tyrosine-type recombinase/integrase [Anaerolineaceae bacterium]
MISTPEKITILNATTAFISMISLSRSKNTARTYQNGLDHLLAVIESHKINPKETTIDQINEDVIIWLSDSLKNQSPATERLYLTAASAFFEYLAAENLANINLPRVRLLIRQRARRPGIRLPQFPKDAIETVIERITAPDIKLYETEQEKLRLLRDRAFLVTLADTGLRVHEACKLRRGDIDWSENRAIIIGKGNKEAVVRFSQRSMQLLREYLAARSRLDGNSGRPLSALPVFARHDRGAGKSIKAMTTTTGRNIVTEWVNHLLGPEAAGTITPHSFRHYFVTRVLQSSGNLKLAQELARHQNIAITQRYAHLSNDELDQGYWQAFEEKN